MAEGSNVSGRNAQRQPRMAGVKLSINTFAEALLNYTGYPSVSINNARPKDNPLACGFLSMVQVLEPHRFDMLMQPEAEISMNIYVNEEFSTQLIVNGNKLLFDHNFECSGEQAVQTFRADTPRHAKYNFKLTIFSDTILQRVDFRIGNSAWFTAILNGRRVLQIRPNGDFFYDQLQEAIRREARSLANQGRVSQEAAEAQLLGHGRRQERTPEQNTAQRGNRQVNMTQPTNRTRNEIAPAPMVRPPSPGYFENEPGTSTNSARTATLRGMAARVNANSINSVLQRRLMSNSRAIEAPAPVTVSDDSE